MKKLALAISALLIATPVFAKSVVITPNCLSPLDSARAWTVLEMELVSRVGPGPDGQLVIIVRTPNDYRAYWMMPNGSLCLLGHHSHNEVDS